MIFDSDANESFIMIFKLSSFNLSEGLLAVSLKSLTSGTPFSNSLDTHKHRFLSSSLASALLASYSVTLLPTIISL